MKRARWPLTSAWLGGAEGYAARAALSLAADPIPWRERIALDAKPADLLDAAHAEADAAARYHGGPL